MQLTKPQWAERVEEALAAQGHTAKWLADEIGKDKSTLSRMMRSHPDYPITNDIQTEIAKTLRVPFSWLFGAEEELFGEETDG